MSDGFRGSEGNAQGGARVQPALSQLLDRALGLHQAGDLSQAKALYEQILVRDPEHADALHFLGVLAYQGGERSRAVELIRKAIAHSAEVGSYHNNLGNVLEAGGDLEGALVSYREALRLEPEDADARFNVGIVLQKLGRVSEAEVSYREALALRSDDAEFHYNLANVLKAQGRLEEAVDAYRGAINLDSASPESHNNLGNTLQRLGRLDEAIQAYRSSLDLKPDDPKAHNNLGNVLLEQGEAEEAVSCYERALQINPHFADASCNLGNAFKFQSRSEAAIGAYREALRVDPNYAEAYNNLGLVHMDRGEVDEAVHCYRKALELNPALSEAYLNLARSRRFSPEDRVEIRCIEALLERDGVSGEALANIHFTLGKIYDDCELFDKAFEHYEAGNRLKRNKVKFDPGDYRSRVARIISTFSRDYFEQRKDCGDESERPIFIVGMARSGTTLVEQIIAGHPQVHGAGELLFIPDMVNRLHERVSSSMPFPACAERIDEVSAHSLTREYLEHLHSLSADALRVTDKMSANFLYLGLIAVMMPRARIVHCRREGMDVCLSNYIQQFAYGHYYSYDLGDVAAYYRGYKRLMSHWREVLPLRMHEVHYEQLVGDQEGESRKLIEFCGLPWDESCLMYYKSRRTVRTASHWQVRQPIYRHSAQRWKRYEKYLGQLKVDLGYEGA